MQLLDALELAEGELHVMQRLANPASFISLNDNILDTVQFSGGPECIGSISVKTPLMTRRKLISCTNCSQG